MSGYCEDFSMSRRARAAYSTGLVPASKIAGIPAALVRRFVRPAEWHHTSKAYNRTDFFDVSEVRAVFGLSQHEEFEADPEAVDALALHRTGAGGAVVHATCRVEWLEWSGTLKRPKATERMAEGCRVEIKGQSATVTLPDGATMVKRLATRGFRYIPTKES